MKVMNVLFAFLVLTIFLSNRILAENALQINPVFLATSTQENISATDANKNQKDAVMIYSCDRYLTFMTMSGYRQVIYKAYINRHLIYDNQLQCEYINRPPGMQQSTMLYRHFDIPKGRVCKTIADYKFSCEKTN